MSTSRNVEDVYGLSPVQEGMLYHTLQAPESGIYVSQIACVFAGLAVEPFQRAWQHVVDRHPALRSAFVWKNTERPLQVVGRRVAVDWRLDDWRHLDAGEQRDRLDEELAADRRRGFKLSKPPLMRLSLLRLGDDRHQFVWTHHHLLVDGWSVSLVVREVLAGYAAFAAGGEPGFDRPRPYRAFVEWLGRQRPEAAEDFWRRELAGVEVPTPLPIDGAPAGGGELGQRRRELSAAATAALHELARDERLTLNSVVQGAWALCLARAADRGDVVFGAVTAGRPPDLRGVDGIVGVFINTLPVRVAVDRQAAVAAWLRGLQAAQAAARDFEHSPLSEVHGWSGVDRRTPLFDSIVAFENYPVERSLDRGGSSLRVSELRIADTSSYALTLIVVPGERLAVKALHDPARLSATAVDRLLDHLATALAAFAADPRRRVGEVPWLSAAARQQVTREWNDTARPQRSAATIHGLFHLQAERRPDAVAVELDGAHLTYGGLARLARRLAARLRRDGVGPEVVAAFVAERSLEMIVAMLAVLEAGGAYLPLDPASPPSRLEPMLRETGARVLLTAGGGEAGTAALAEGRRIVDVSAHLRRDGADGADDGAGDGATVADAAGAAGADNLAYVLYTSGSTGGPKGVAMPHRGPVRLVRDPGWVELGAGEVHLLLAPVSFDASVFEIWGALLNGARLVLMPPGPPSLAEIGGVLRRHRVTTLWLGAGLFHQMVEERLADLGGLRQLLAGGDTVSASHVRRLLEEHPDCRLIDGYGPTENAVFTCCHTAWPSSVADRVPIGRPVDETSAQVLDGGLRPVAIGVAGELCAGGEGLARGYFGSPGLTAERFVPDPLATTPGARLYRTGDRVRRRGDGVLEYLGRGDRQVKIRGFRVEPAEVEAALGEHPEVAQAVVVAERLADADARLVAYVVPRPGAAPGVAALRAHLATRLPESMTPTAWVTLPALPLTVNGKLDRAALPSPEPAAPRRERSFHTPLEEALCGIWAELLRLPAVDRGDDFLALGGHSLLATRLVSRVRHCFGVDLPLRAVFENPTPEELAVAVEAALRGGGARSSPPIPAVPRGGPLPLSSGQRRLWRAQRLAPGGADFNVPQAVRLRGALGAAALAATVAEARRRHEGLRTAFPSRDGEPVQVIQPAEPPAPLPVVDLSGLPPAVRQPVLAGLLAGAAQRPFELAAGAPLRVALFRLAGEEHALLFVAHHIVCDAWSMGLLLAEVGGLYEAAAAGRPFPGGAPALQLADVAAWQRGWLEESGELERQLDYWRGRLDGCPPVLALPLDRPRSASRRARGAKVRVRVGAAATRRLEELARAEGATLFMTLLALYQALLHRVAGDDDVAVGVPVAGRSRREMEEVVGFFVNTLVLRTDLGGDPSFRRLIARVRDTALAAFAHQDVPFDLLVERLDPPRRPGSAPFFQVTFMLLNAPDGGLRLPGLEASSLEVEGARLRSDLQLQLLEVPDGLVGAFHYDASLFDAETAEDLARRFAALVAAAAADPEAPISALPLLDAGETATLYAGFAGSLEEA